MSRLDELIAEGETVIASYVRAAEPRASEAVLLRRLLAVVKLLWDDGNHVQFVIDKVQAIASGEAGGGENG